MKKYVKELVVLTVQLFMFYIFPLFAGPTDAMGMVLLILMATFVLSIVLASISGNKIKYLYPVVAAAVFLPSIFLYYNESALVHSLWYLVDAAIGIGIGTAIRTIIRRF